MTFVLQVAATPAGNVSTANTDEYFRLTGHLQKNSAEAPVQIKCGSTYEFAYLQCRLTANSVAATSDFKLRINGADSTNLTVSITSSGTGLFVDATGSDTVAVNDLVNYETDPGAATGTFTFTLMAIQAEEAPGNDIYTLGTSFPTISAASTTYYSTLGGYAGGTLVTTSDDNVEVEMAKAGNTRNLWTYVQTNARTTNTSIKTRKNNADATQEVVYASGETGIKQETIDTDQFLADDDLGYSVTTGTGAGNLVGLNIWIEVMHDEPDEFDGGVSITGTNETVTVTDNTTRYYPLGGRLQDNSTEANIQCQYKDDLQFSCLRCRISQNSVTATSTLTLRANAADTALVVSITASTTGIFADNDEVDPGTEDSTDLSYEVTCPSTAGTTTITMKWITIWMRVAAAPAGAAADIIRRSFAGGHISSPLLISAVQFGSFKNADTDNRPIFGQLSLA